MKIRQALSGLVDWGVVALAVFFTASGLTTVPTASASESRSPRQVMIRGESGSVWGEAIPANRPKTSVPAAPPAPGPGVHTCYVLDRNFPYFPIYLYCEDAREDGGAMYPSAPVAYQRWEAYVATSRTVTLTVDVKGPCRYRYHSVASRSVTPGWWIFIHYMTLPSVMCVGTYNVTFSVSPIDSQDPAR